MVAPECRRSYMGRHGEGRVSDRGRQAAMAKRANKPEEAAAGAADKLQIGSAQ